MIGKLIKKAVSVGTATARLLAREVRERVQRPDLSDGTASITDESPATCAAIQVVPPHELLALLESSTAPLLLDCRDDVEWVAGCIVGATHMPMASLPDRVGSMDSSAAVIIVCLNGMESLEVAEYLIGENGFHNVRVLDGGMVGWYADLGQTRIRVLRAEERTP